VPHQKHRHILNHLLLRYWFYSLKVVTFCVMVPCSDTMWLTKTFRENRPFLFLRLTYTWLSDWWRPSMPFACSNHILALHTSATLRILSLQTWTWRERVTPKYRNKCYKTAWYQNEGNYISCYVYFSIQVFASITLFLRSSILKYLEISLIWDRNSKNYWNCIFYWNNAANRVGFCCSRKTGRCTYFEFVFHFISKLKLNLLKKENEAETIM